MKETSAEPPDIDQPQSGLVSPAPGVVRRAATQPASGGSIIGNNPLSPLAESTPSAATSGKRDSKRDNGLGTDGGAPVREKDGALAALPQVEEGSGSVVEDKDGEGKPKPTARGIWQEFRHVSWMIITHSWINLLLVFVPIGIAMGFAPGINGGIVFAMNSIAIIPLAGLLSYATESVASKLGDTLGALLNVTFGNAVELIIFIIALAKNEIRIVQASLLGSILANLLLILGMCFFFGGLRFREQIYNSTVTQMSACLLSLSVISLVLPTAFHASFSDPAKADQQSLKVSRGTSVILLLVYAIYLLFQLQSHAYLYESTPQHIVDAEALPGPAVGWLDSSSSSDSSSDSSDSDDSSRSRDTMRRKMKKVLRGGRRRKSSLASVDANEVKFARTPSFGTSSGSPHEASEGTSPLPDAFAHGPAAEANEEAVEDEKAHRRHKKHPFHRRKHRKSKKRDRRDDEAGDTLQPTISERPENGPEASGDGEPRRVDFAVQEAPSGGDALNQPGVAGPSRRPFPTLRGISVKTLTPTVFNKPDGGPIQATTSTSSGPVPRVRYGIRRTNSLPDRLNQQQSRIRPPGAMMPSQIPMAALTGGNGATEEAEAVDEIHLTKVASVILLLVSTGLVAFCAELLVSSIESVTESSSVGQIFIGLIILPIVGNAAEHVTALTVAMKNKVDLAIGVAVGSSIQIALFVTPLIVLLGWMMDKDMSLYFTLFETVCLFVSAFMVNFLVLDGRSNYLEGALLCAVYVIIAVVAFFYPDGDDASAWGQ